jgi:hypothetical protein
MEESHHPHLSSLMAATTLPVSLKILTSAKVREDYQPCSQSLLGVILSS